MTRTSVIATRNGRPAYENAQPRLRASQLSRTTPATILDERPLLVRKLSKLFGGRK